MFPDLTHSAITRTINIATLIELAYYCHLCIQCTFRRSSDSGVFAYRARLGLRLSTNPFCISGVHQVKEFVKDTNKSFCLFGMGVVLL